MSSASAHVQLVVHVVVRCVEVPHHVHGAANALPSTQELFKALKVASKVPERLQMH